MTRANYYRQWFIGEEVSKDQRVDCMFYAIIVTASFGDILT